MTTADKLVAARLPVETAKAIIGDNESVTAVGSTSADAYAVREALTVVTAGASTTGLILPAANKNDSFVIVNNSGSDKVLYPPSGGKLQNGTADASAVLLDKSMSICVCTGTVDYSVLSNGIGA